MVEPYPVAVQVEMRTSAVYLEGRDVDVYDRSYAYLKAAALSPEESREMIESVAESLL